MRSGIARVGVGALASWVAVAGLSGSAGAQVVRVRDINPGAGDSSPFPLVDIDGVLFFGADDGAHGSELWRSDGTEAGTTMVKDLNATAGSAPGMPVKIPAGTFFPAVPAGSACGELFKTDGTAAGTVQVTTGCPDADMRWGEAVQATSSKLFFGARSTGNGTELWTSDGTAAGTRQVIDLYPLDGNGFHAAPAPSMGVLGERVIFPGESADSGEEPWISDGTAVGTTLLADTLPLSASSTIRGFTRVGTFVYFIQDAVTRQLWRTDGTPDGTLPVVRSGGSWPIPAVIGSTVYFVGADLGTGAEPWKTDGITSERIRDVFPGSTTSSPRRLTVSGGVLYFSAADGSNGAELWRSNGTQAGTVVVKDIAPGAASSSPDLLVDFQGTLYFTATDGAHGVELWKSDGTAAGTVMVADLVPGATGGLDVPSTATFRPQIVVSGGHLFFHARDDQGIELWTLGTGPVVEPGVDGGTDAALGNSDGGAGADGGGAPADGAGGAGAGGTGGAGGGGATGAGGGAAPADAAAGDGAPGPTHPASKSGCGCHTGDDAPGPAPTLLLLLAGAIVFARRRR